MDVSTICPILDGETLHDYTFLLLTKKRVVCGKKKTWKHTIKVSVSLIVCLYIDGLGLVCFLLQLFYHPLSHFIEGEMAYIFTEDQKKSNFLLTRDESFI